MYHSDVISLVDQTFAPDKYAIERLESEQITTIYGDRKSVTHEEIKTAEQRGFKSVCRVEVWNEEYKGQKIAEVGGQRLEIYRTYCPGEKIELYLGEKVGAPDG